MMRREEKYLANGRDLAVLSARLRGVLRPDPHGTDGSYHVRSLYYDDAAERALFDKLAGVRDRHKWRVRIYDHRDARIRLERKVRRDRWVRKEACIIDRTTADRLRTGRAPLDHPEPLVRAFAVEQRRVGLKPVVIVDYRRTAWVHRAGDVRITLDRRLRSGGTSTALFDPKIPVLPVFAALEAPGTAIVEVKWTKLLPVHIASLIPRSLGAPSALSKYVLCRRPLAFRRWEDA